MFICEMYFVYTHTSGQAIAEGSTKLASVSSGPVAASAGGAAAASGDAPAEEAKEEEKEESDDVSWWEGKWL